MRVFLCSLLLLAGCAALPLEVVGQRAGPCPSGELMSFTYYGHGEDATYYDIALDGVVLLRVYFDGPDGEAGTVRLQVPPRTTITFATLRASFPSPCDLRALLPKGA